MATISIVSERQSAEVPKPGPKKDSATIALIAEELGVPRRTAFDRMRQADQYEQLEEARPDLAEKVAAGEMRWSHPMVMIEGRGEVKPNPKRIAIGRSELALFHSIAEERAKRRYVMRTDKWGRGLSSGIEVASLGFVPKAELPILTGLVGEYAAFNYLAQYFGAINVHWNPQPMLIGDGGRDLEVFGRNVQVKTRRSPYGKTLVRRVQKAGGSIEPLDFDVLVGSQWIPSNGGQVLLLGWCQRERLFDSNFSKSRFNHFNLEIIDDHLLPMQRLIDHLTIKQEAGR